MGSRRKSAKKRDPNQSTATQRPGQDEATSVARLATRPAVQAGITLKEYGKGFGDLDLSALIEMLSEQTKAANEGDLRRAEAMLAAQAHTLDAIFNNLARRAALNMGEYLGACETYLKLALRAQLQCRATWEALATIKNPPVMGYVRQANIAHGHQQVNNATGEDSSRERPRAGENANPKSKLLEDTDGERLDPGTARSAVGANSELATVGKVHGA